MNSEMEALRQQLDDYQLPEHYGESSAGAAVETVALVAQYQAARDEYLRRKVQRSVLEAVTTTYDAASGTFALPCPVPTPDEHMALDERRAQVLRSVTEKAVAVQRRLLELQAKHGQFQLRREEFHELLVLQQTQGEDDTTTASMEWDDGDADIDEPELAAQEAELQARRVELEVQLRSVQQQHAKAVEEVASRQSKLGELFYDDDDSKENAAANLAALVKDPAALQELKKANLELQSEIDKLKEIANFYDNLRLLMEELSGIRIVSVVQQSSPAAGGGGPDTMLLTVQLLHQYDVEIVLEVTGPKKKEFTIPSARVASHNAVITGPALDEDNASVVRLTIPSLDDIVSLAAGAAAASAPTGENLRIVLRESLARIRMVQERVLELTELQQEAGVVTQVGPFRGAHDQEVVCSLNAPQITIVLRLTPDCPLTDGSVYLDQLVGLGGWEAAVLARLAAAVRARQYRRPAAVLRAVAAEVQRLRDEEGVPLPSTPTLPVRHAGREW